MKTSDFYYDLPHELIAQTPLLDRQKSRMMVVDKLSGSFKHEKFEKNFISDFGFFDGNFCISGNCVGFRRN